jgi:hypothetical protein
VSPRAGRDDVEKGKFLSLPELKLRPLGRPARSQSLYRLSNPGSSKKKKTKATIIKTANDYFMLPREDTSSLVGRYQRFRETSCFYLQAHLGKMR